MVQEKNTLEQYISDTITDRPYGFKVAEKSFYLYPLTLGKLFRIQSIIEKLEVNQQELANNISVEALRLAKEKKDECITIICYHTCKTKDEVNDAELVLNRKAFFSEELSESDIATLMIAVLSADKTTAIMHYLKIDKEQERLSAVMRIKSKGDKNNIVFGGFSVFGTMLDAACERYGWTEEYVTWGIGYTKLRLMLADKVNSVYCSDDELKKIPLNLRIQKNDTIKATKETMQDIKKMDWK